MEEKRALEEKSTFLHFTQEQLNIQVEILEGEKQKLEKEVEELRTRVADLENELVRFEKDETSKKLLSCLIWKFGDHIFQCSN